MLRVLEVLKGKEKKNAKLSCKHKGLKDNEWIAPISELLRPGAS